MSLTGLLVRIVAEALLRHPLANAQYADGKIKLFDEVYVMTRGGPGTTTETDASTGWSPSTGAP